MVIVRGRDIKKKIDFNMWGLDLIMGNARISPKMIQAPLT